MTAPAFGIAPPALSFRDSVTGFSHGQMDCVMQAFWDGEPAGRLSYSDYRREPAIAMIEVAPEFRRRGIARAMVHRLQELYPETEINFGLMTDDGAAFRASLAFREVPLIDLAKVERFRERFAALTRRVETEFESSTGQERRNWYRMDNAIDRIERSGILERPVKRILVRGTPADGAAPEPAF
ncbi:GNAT family N-acetyltransferase [Cereibacter sphaeroides]|uniref:GNAT family N-acetyltransferase n=1 Tax=Cereibacter sphaeroides TaxID=1063 RepID=UPI001F4877BA|nr:GNAT family N-acetyltransferase [Cereibacter sphaeroides]MCE6957742.1 GNAT family N-acetyltransferase [Cereibacter sphaeroides]MCE6971632.1 GNAT family N-acetyltransferase [Cereibacter sphaeroides]